MKEKNDKRKLSFSKIMVGYAGLFATLIFSFGHMLAAGYFFFLFLNGMVFLPMVSLAISIWVATSSFIYGWVGVTFFIKIMEEK